MLFYEDFTKKITDFFTLDYKFATPLSLIVSARDKYFMNYYHRTNFPMSIVGPTLDNECRFGYSRDNLKGSFGISSAKLDMDLEYIPRGLLPAGNYLGFKTYKSISPRVITTGFPEDKKVSWGFDCSLENQFSFATGLGHTLKFICDEIHFIPKVGFSTLYNRKPYLFGFNCIFDKAEPRYTGPFEVLLGFTPIDGITTYIRHEVNHFEYPGKILLGVYSRAIFEMLRDKMTKTDVKSKVVAMPTEFIAEAGVDLKKGGMLFDGRAGVKFLPGKHYVIQAKYDSNYKLGAAFGYLPKKWLKLIWSVQIDTKKLVTHPTGGVDYLGGFSLEFDFSPL